jgi:hypothetical protein
MKFLDAPSLEIIAELFQNLTIEDNIGEFMSLDLSKLNNDTVTANLDANNLGVLAPYIDIIH